MKPSLSSVPEVTELPRRMFKYAILATDGFWENTNNQQVADLLRQNCSGTDGLARKLYNSFSPKASDNSTIVCFELD